jgi:hypothetical protein
MATLACDLYVFANRIPAGLAAIFLPRCGFTHTWNMSALCCLLIRHFSISSALVCVRILVMGELLLLHHSMHFDLQTKRSPNYMVSFTVRTEGKRERCPTDDTLSVHGRATNGWDWESEEGQLQLASEDRGIASNATT